MVKVKVRKGALLWGPQCGLNTGFSVATCERVNPFISQAPLSVTLCLRYRGWGHCALHWCRSVVKVR
jgi:hypothetical protein